MNKFQLRGRNLDDLKTQIIAEHGPQARIVGAEKVTQGGIGGFLARKYFEVTVEVPRRAAARHAQVDPADRVGIASLLEDADAADSGTHDAFHQLELSTNAVGFDAVVADLSARAGLRPRETESQVGGGLASGGAGGVGAAGGAGVGGAGVAGAVSGSAAAAASDPVGGTRGTSTPAGFRATVAPVWPDEFGVPAAPPTPVERSALDALGVSAASSAASAPSAASVSAAGAAGVSARSAGSAGSVTSTQPAPSNAPGAPSIDGAHPSPRTNPGRQAFARAPEDLLTPGTRFPLIPAPTRSPGDLTLIVGLGRDALAVARGMAGEGSVVDLRAGGSLGFEHSDPVRDRRSAMTARADAVHRDRAVFVAYGLDPTADFAEILRSIGADQVWAAVDAGRKHEDTDRWLRALSEAVGVDALAVIGSHRTATPQTVGTLGVPIGWVEDLSAAHHAD